MSHAPTPCIDVCKYKLRGHCIACSMTKAQKQMAERLRDPEAMAAFVRGLVAQQEGLGRPFWAWEQGYRAKCARAGVPCPLDAVSAAAE